MEIIMTAVAAVCIACVAFYIAGEICFNRGMKALKEARRLLDAATQYNRELLEMIAQFRKENYIYSPDLCDVEGCEQPVTTSGIAWSDTGYWSVCHFHNTAYRNGEQQPIMKQSAIDRENSRDENGFLTGKEFKQL